MTRQWIEHLNAFNLVIEQRYPHCVFSIFRRKNIQHIAAHAEHAALELHVIAFVLHFGEALDGLALREFFVLAQVQNHAVIIHRIADTVDRRHRGHDDDITPLHQRFGRRQTHLLDVFVDAGIFLDKQIFRRHISFGLVVVVIRDEILHRVFREKLAHFGIQLRRQRLVGRHDDRRHPQTRNHMRHGVGLAGTGDAQQRLIRQAVAQSFSELVDGLRLVARRLKRLM